MNMGQAEKVLNGLVGALCNYTPTGQLKTELEAVRTSLNAMTAPVKVSETIVTDPTV